MTSDLPAFRLRKLSEVERENHLNAPTQQPNSKGDTGLHTFNLAVREWAFFREVEGFTGAIMHQAIANGWTADKDFVQRVARRMGGSLRIEHDPAARDICPYRWQHRHKPNLAFANLFDHNGTERELTHLFASMANTFLDTATELAVQDRQGRPEEQQVSLPAFWEAAAASFRFLNREDRALSYEVLVSQASSDEGASADSGGAQTEIVVVPRHVFDRKARRDTLKATLAELKKSPADHAGSEASILQRIKDLRKLLADPELSGDHVCHDEAIVIEAKVAGTKQLLAHATNSSLFKTSHIKNVTLSNGNLWFGVLSGPKLYIGWLNARLIVQFGPIDAEEDYIAFLQAILLLARKGVTSTSQPCQLARAADAAALASSSAWPSSAMLHHPTTPTLDAAHLSRPELKAGGEIAFKTPSGEQAKLHILSDVTGKDVRCCGRSRGHDHQAIGKHTDVYIVDGRITEGSDGNATLEQGRYVVNTSSPCGEYEVKALRRLHDLVPAPSMKARIPVVLNSGFVSVNQSDPVSATLWKARLDEDLRSSLDSDTLDALGDIRQLFLTVYKDETFALHSLPERHYLAVISEAAFTLTYLSYEAGFIHRDVSDSNIASKLSPEDLVQKDTSIEKLLQRRMDILEHPASPSANASTATVPWWKQYAQDDLALCVLLDPENACFVTGKAQDNLTETEEIEAIFSGTPMFGARIDWDTRTQETYPGNLLFPHHTGDDLEALKQVGIWLAARLERQRTRGNQRSRIQCSADAMRRLVNVPAHAVKRTLAQPDMLGPNHPLLGFFTNWHMEHAKFYILRSLDALAVDCEAPFEQRRQAMLDSPKIREGADVLFRNVVRLTTQAALDAYKVWRS